MKLYYFNFSGIPGYSMVNISRTFKMKYPKKYIICSIEKNQVYNVDELKDIPIPFSKYSYVFIDEKPTSKKTTNKNTYIYQNAYENNLENILRIYPMDLSNYLTDSKNNVIVKFYPKKNITDPRLLNDIVICNNLDFMLKLDLKQTFQGILDNVFEKVKLPKTTEEWLLDFLDCIPYGPNFQIHRFPNIINDEIFKKPFHPILNDFVFGYCIRVDDMKKELKMIKHFEQDISNLDREINIYNNYNNILDRLIPALKKQKIPFKNNKTFIRIKALDFYKLKDISFTITDFLK